jgi:hypothetical protein
VEERAILNLLSAELVEREEYTVPVLLPAFLHQFPNGLGRNRATCEKLTWRAFVRKASAYFAKEHNIQWLRNINSEWADWYDRYVAKPDGQPQP